jgi:hypothetical protein
VVIKLKRSEQPGQIMEKSVSHNFDDESLEAKTQWFKSLSIQERIEMFGWFVDMALAVNPSIMEHKDAQPVVGRIRVLSKT